MTSLPPEVPHCYQSTPSIQTAYNVCLALEKKMESPKDAVEKRNLVYVRILGHLIHVVPNKSITGVVAAIVSAKNDSALLELGQYFFDYYIREFWTNEEITPTPSTHSSQSPSPVDNLVDYMKPTLIAATPSYDTARKCALFRDDFKCVLTGIHDASLLKIPDLLAKLEAGPVPIRGMEHTHCAHIFPESRNFNLSAESQSPKNAHAASIWAVMDLFGYKNVPTELNGNLVHRLENVLTLGPGIHGSFYRLSVWLKATDRLDTYTVEASSPYLIAHCHREVTFTTPDPVKYPPPSPDYLALHAACAQVAQLSGAADLLAKFYQDKDDQGVLDPEGGSALLLEDALRVVQL